MIDWRRKPLLRSPSSNGRAPLLLVDRWFLFSTSLLLSSSTIEWYLFSRGGAPVIREGGEASGLLTAVTWHQFAPSEDRFPQKPVLKGSYPCPQTRSIVSLGAERLVFLVIRVSAGSPPHPGTGRAYWPPCLTTILPYCILTNNQNTFCAYYYLLCTLSRKYTLLYS